jgi:hydrogenase maturation protease
MSMTNQEELVFSEKTETFVRTLLYEGYALFPYHRTAIKNQKPVPFGVVYPVGYSKSNPYCADTLKSECILIREERATLHISIRFLQMMRIQVYQDDEQLPEITVDNHKFYTGWQVIERRINLEPIIIHGSWQQHQLQPFTFERKMTKENLNHDNTPSSVYMLKTTEELQGRVNATVEPLQDKAGFRISVQVKNLTALRRAVAASREEIMLHSFLSTHTLMKCAGGNFISHQNTPIAWQEEMNACTQINQWPILMEEDDSCMLASPIIVYDHPVLNSKSPGDLFDSTEIEEALMLHLAVMSDEEKSRLSENDEKMEMMLNRIGQVMPEEWIQFHGGMTPTTKD